MNFHRCSIQTALLDVMWFWTNPIGCAPQLLSGIGLWLQTSFNWKLIVSLNLYCCVCMGWLGCASQVLSCIYVHCFFNYAVSTWEKDNGHVPCPLYNNLLSNDSLRCAKQVAFARFSSCKRLEPAVKQCSKNSYNDSNIHVFVFPA